MKWILANATDQQHVYELWNEDEKLISFSQQLAHGTIRIISKNPRVFILRNQRFNKNKTELLNEYGIKIATLTEENPMKFGYIDLEEKKLLFTIQNYLHKTALISDAVSEKKLVTCELPPNSYIAPLLILCWYQFELQEKEMLEAVL
jgi:hypothetical protein